MNLRDAATGEVLWSVPAGDVGRGVAIDIDPRHPGLECWGAGGGLRGLYSARGERIAPRSPPSCNMAVWWDGDRQRELLDGTRIEKWLWEPQRSRQLLDAGRFNCVSINGTKANPCFSGDILGDWREEVLWPASDGQELRVFATTLPTSHRFVALAYDHVYRMGMVWQNVGYNQPAHPERPLRKRQPDGAAPSASTPAGQ